MVFENRDLGNKPFDQRFIKFCDGGRLLPDEILQVLDQAHLLILDYAVHLCLFSHIPEPEDFIRDGVVIALLIRHLHELLLQLPEAFIDDFRRQGISLFDHCGNVGLQGFQEVVLFKPEYCFQCPEYPCERYAHIDEYDSFLTHRNQKADLGKMQRIGEEAYNAEQVEKRQILDRLLAAYNDGRKKTLFCLAVNLVPLEDLRTVFEGDDMEIPVKERAKLMEKRLKERSSVELKLRRK